MIPLGTDSRSSHSSSLFYSLAEGRPERPEERWVSSPSLAFISSFLANHPQSTLTPVIEAPLFHLQNEKNHLFLDISCTLIPFSGLLFACSSA